MTTLWQSINNAAASTVEQISQRVVQIRGQDGGIGAGTIWHSDGLIITNAHVVVQRDGQAKQPDLEVELWDGRLYRATILTTDTQLDLAALAIDARDLPAAQIGHSGALKPGEWLMASGHPWGIADALTAGVVIGIGANLPEQNDGRTWIALDMHMRPGHSGGPLFNSVGEIVGINTMIRGPEVSFAIPVDVVKHFLKETLGPRIEAELQAVRHTPSPADSDMTII